MGNPGSDVGVVYFHLSLEYFIDAVDGIVFFLVDDFCIYLRWGDILVPRQFACRV